MMRVEHGNDSRNRFRPLNAVRDGLLIGATMGSMGLAAREAHINPVDIAQQLANRVGLTHAAPDFAVTIRHGSHPVATTEYNAFLPAFTNPEYVMIGDGASMPVRVPSAAEIYVGLFTSPMFVGAEQTAQGAIIRNKRMIARGVSMMVLPTMFACAVGPEISQLTATPPAEIATTTSNPEAAQPASTATSEQSVGATLTPEKPPLSDTEMQKVVDGVNTRIAPMNLKLVKDASGNYFVSKDGTTHLTDNLTLLPSGEFQIKLSDGEQWKFSPADVLATLAANNMKDYQLHAAAWEIDQQTGAITWIPKEEIRDAPGSMFLASTETDIATAWRLHELPDSYLDTLFTGADTSIPWVITDDSSIFAKTVIYPKSDMISPVETTLSADQIPARSVPYMYQLSDYDNISVFYTFIKQNKSTSISVNNIQTTSNYAQFLSTFDSYYVNPSNPAASIINKLDPANSGATSSSTKDSAGRNVKEVFIPFAELQEGPDPGWITGTTTHTLFPDDPTSVLQQERVKVLTDGAQSGDFQNADKYLWPTDAIVAQAGK